MLQYQMTFLRHENACYAVLRNMTLIPRKDILPTRRYPSWRSRAEKELNLRLDGVGSDSLDHLLEVSEIFAYH